MTVRCLLDPDQFVFDDMEIGGLKALAQHVDDVQQDSDRLFLEYLVEFRLARISHQSLPMTGATGEKCSGDSIEVNRVRIFHTNSPFSLSLHKGMCRTKWYPSLPAGVKNPG
ncbi:MAG: hypothetical protein AMXMBFR4_01030 [Candidatus Hydrogenedentota bacterium]